MICGRERHTLLKGARSFFPRVAGRRELEEREELEELEEPEELEEL